MRVSLALLLLSLLFFTILIAIDATSIILLVPVSSNSFVFYVETEANMAGYHRRSQWHCVRKFLDRRVLPTFYVHISANSVQVVGHLHS